MKPAPSTLWPDVAPQWILNLPEKFESFFYDIYKCFIYDDRYQLYVDGLIYMSKVGHYLISRFEYYSKNN